MKNQSKLAKLLSRLERGPIVLSGVQRNKHNLVLRDNEGKLEDQPTRTVKEFGVSNGKPAIRDNCGEWWRVREVNGLYQQV